MTKPITDTDRIDFIASINQSICQLSMPGDVVRNNIHSLRAAIDYCIDNQQQLEDGWTPDKIEEASFKNKS